MSVKGVRSVDGGVGKCWGMYGEVWWRCENVW